MASNLWTEGEKVLAAVGARWLTAKRDVILSFIDRENPVLADALFAAIKKAEPGGLEMAMVAKLLNKILDGLDDQEKAALPPLAESLVDYVIAKLNAFAAA